MNKILQKRASNLLKQNQDKSGFINNIKSYEELFETIISFVNYNLLEEAKKSLEFAIKYQNRKGQFEFERLIGAYSYDDGKVSPIYFLKALLAYLCKINDKREISRYIRSIRRSLDYLENHFDDTYLLFYGFDDRDLKTFLAKENAVFLNFSDELSDLLNTFDSVKETDRIFMLKGKIELGFQRYFWHRTNKMMIGRFFPQIQVFEHPKFLEQLLILSEYVHDEDFHKKIVKKHKDELKWETSILKILMTLIEMKRLKDRDFEKEFKKYEKYLEDFPELIVKGNFSQEIEKSLFGDFKENIKELENKKITLVNLGQIQTANLILKLLKNEQ